jgi:hypothetical protein
LGSGPWGGRALAQPLPEAATPAQREAAASAYQKGKAAYEAGDYAGALDAFRRSYAAVRSPNTKLMVARSLRELFQDDEARAAFEQTIAEAEQTGDATYAPAADAARQELAALRGGAPPGPGEPAPAAEPVAIEASLDAAELVDADPAEPSDSPLDRRADSGLALGAKLGGGIGAPLSELGATPVFEVELGYFLPLGDPIGRSLELFVSGQYAQPKLDGRTSEADDRLPADGIASYELTQQQLTLTLGALYHIPVGSDLLMPYGGLGGRMYLLNTKVTGEAGGEAFGENEETQTDFGLLVVAGLDVFAGPGALLAELQLGWAGVDGYVLRDTNVGALQLVLGYRFVL